MGQHPHSRLRAGRTHRRSAYEPLPGPLPQSRTHLGHQTVTAHPDPQPSPETTRTCAVAVLTGLRPSPTRHAVVGFRSQGRLTQGPAVRPADRLHPLRQSVLTWTRSAYGQVRCAVVALWSGREGQYADQIRPARTEFDSILTASPVIAF